MLEPSAMLGHSSDAQVSPAAAPALHPQVFIKNTFINWVAEEAVEEVGQCQETRKCKRSISLPPRSFCDAQWPSHNSGDTKAISEQTTVSDRAPSSSGSGTDEVAEEQVWDNRKQRTAIANGTLRQDRVSAPVPCNDACKVGGSMRTEPWADACGKGRWWLEVEDVCALSGFPVKLLPYPPFKLQTGPRGPVDSTQLVDGVYLVLQVLATWNFSVLGVRLAASTISAIDTYMKRCKLGPFRLAHALELSNRGTPEAREELRELRERAAHRFKNVQEIQRIRHGKKNQKRKKPQQLLQQQQPQHAAQKFPPQVQQPGLQSEHQKFFDEGCNGQPWQSGPQQSAIQEQQQQRQQKQWQQHDQQHNQQQRQQRRQPKQCQQQHV